MMMLYALVAVCALSGLLCAESTETGCSKIKSQENFNYSMLVGHWQIAEISENYIRGNTHDYGQATTERDTVDFQLDEDKSKKLIWTINKNQTKETLPMVIVDEPTNPAKFNATYDFLGKDNTIPHYLNIVGTDYVDYAIFSVCDNRRVDILVILVKKMDLVTVSMALKRAQKQGLNHKFCPVETCPVITCPK